MFFPWPGRANKRTKQALRDKSSRARQPHRLQIDPLEDRRLLAVYVEAEASFFDAARPQDVSVQEGNAGLTNAVFRVTLDNAEAAPVTVDMRTADGLGTAAAVAGSDYFAGAAQITFLAGETEQFVTVGVFGDSVAELDEQFFVFLSNFTGTGGIIKAPGAPVSDVAGRGVVTVLDDDVTFIQIDDVQVTETDAGTVNAVFAVTLSGPDSNTVTVNFATSGGTATANIDYQTTSGIVTFNPGEVSKTITVTVIGDTQDEVNETFFVNLSNPVNAQLQDNQGQGNIVDNEGILVNIGNASTLEGDTGVFRNMVFTVTLSAARPSTINVQYRTDNVVAPPAQVIPARVGTAPFQRPNMIAQPTLAYQQNDYIPVSGLLTFAPNVTSQNITVQIRGENIHELNETFLVLLTSVTTNGGETINPVVTQAVGTILNDDQVPQLVIHDASTQGGFAPGTGQPINDEGDNPLLANLFPEFIFSLLGNPEEAWTRPVRINVSLSNPSSGSIAVAYSTIGETATPGIDYRRSFPNHNSAVLGGATTYFLGGQAATILDATFGDPLNDNTGNPQDIDPPFDITEYGPGQQPLTQPGGPSPTTGLPNEYAQVIFQPGDVSEEIVLRIFKEAGPRILAMPEGDETFLIRADGFSANSAAAVIADDTGRVTIIDDDPDPTIGISNATIVEGDTGQKFLLFTVGLNTQSELPISVDFRTQQLVVPNGAEANVDYVTTIGTLTFNPRVPQIFPLPIIPGVTSQAFSVPIIGDFLDEVDEIFQVILSNPINATIPGAGTATGTIIDNEGPTASLGPDVTVVEGNGGTVNAVFSVSLGSASLQDVRVGFFTSNGSASGGQDYTATSGTLTFAAGTSAPQPITVSVLGDTLFEGTEFFLLNLTNPDPLVLSIGDNQAVGIILDDDFLPAVRIDDASVVEGNVGTSNLVFRLRLVNPDGSPLTTPMNQPVGVGFFTENNSALSGLDYTTTSGNLVFDHTLAQTEKFVTVPVIGDLLAEVDEKLLLRLTSPVNTTLFNSTGEGTIVDDDSVPGISVVSRNAFEFEGNNLLFDVSLSRPSTSQITVVFNTANGSAISGSDYTATTGTLTFAAGETTKTISVASLTDGLAEANETFTVGLTAPTNAVVASGPATGTIVDIDSTAIIVGNATVLEGGNIVFPVRLSRVEALTVNVDIATAIISASDPADYTGTAGVLTFNPGETTIDITVATLGDSIDEIDETFALNLSNPVNANLANAQGIATIIDDDGPTVSIGDAAGFEGNAGLVFFDFVVSLSTGSQQPVTVVFTTLDGSAIDEVPGPDPNDYFFRTGTITFAPGEVTKPVRINVLGDNVDEIDETFFVQISNALSNGFALGITDATGQGTIVDDDGPTINTQTITVQEGSSGLVFANFVVSLSAPSPQFVTVQYFTSDGTAIGNIDYLPTNGTITFPPNTTTAAIVQVQIVPDTTPEPDETFFLNLASPSGGARLGVNPIQATILDDDTLLFISNATVTEMDSGVQAVALNVTMNQVRPTPVTVVFNTVDGTALAGQDYNASTGTLTIAAGATSAQVIVQVRNDLIDEPSESFDVVLSMPIGAFLGDAIGTIFINDNNDPRPTMSVNNPTVAEGNSGSTNALFNVTLSGLSGRTITAVFTTADVSATAGFDYTATSGTLSFLPGETSKQIAVPVTGETAVEANETFQLNLSSIQFANPASLVGTGTIIDDDASLSITDATVVETNSAVNAVFSVLLSKASSVPVTMDFTTTNGTAIAGQDYATNSGSLSFAPGQTSMAVTVQVLGDLLDEVNETFTVNLSNIVGAAAVANNFGIGTIVDEDPLPDLSISDTSIVEGDAGTIDAVFTVSLSQPSGKTVTVAYTTNPGTAVAGSDYQTVTGTLTFFPGENNKPIQVPVNGDFVLEQDETFFVDLSAVSNATLVDVQGLGTILDDEPRMAIGDAALVEGNSGSTFLVFPVTLTKAAGPGNITVDFNTVPGSGTATESVDYLPVNSALTFFPGDNSRTISVAIQGDVLNEADETFTLFLSNVNGAFFLNNQATGTIFNDDALPIVTITDFSQAEGDSGLSNFFFTVTLDAVSGRAVTVQFATANGVGAGGATAGSDYQARSGTLTFQPGETSIAISVPVVGDPTVEQNETFFVNLTNLVNGAFGDSQGVGTIVNDEPSLTIGDATVTEQDAGPVAVTFPITLSRPSSVPVSVVLNTANQTAFSPTDYTLVSNATLTFAIGQTSQNLTVLVQGDLIDEDNETFLVNLSGTSSGASLNDPQGVGTIIDNDDPPTISISTATTLEGNAGNTPAVFTVMLSSASGRQVTVNFQTADNTATVFGIPNGDYFGTAGTLTFAPGTLAQNITVNVRGDTNGEGDESYFVNLLNPLNATLGVAQGLGVIIDDEPRLSISDATVAEGDFVSPNLIFNVSLSAPATGVVTVQFNTLDGTALNGLDYTGTTGSITFQAGVVVQSITVQTLADLADEIDEQFTINLSGATGNVSVFDGVGVGNILDDDSPPTISIDSISVDEGESGQLQAVFTVSLSAASGRQITVTYITADVTASGASDYVATPLTTLTFAPGEVAQNVTVLINGDTLAEPNETFEVRLSNPINASLGLGTGTGVATIRDDEPRITISDLTISEGNSGLQNAVFNVFLSVGTTSNVTVAFATQNGTATSPSDFTATSGTLVFLPTQLAQTVTVQVQGDMVLENNEVFLINLSSPSNNAIILDGQAQGLISNDDPFPLVSISDASVTEGDVGTVNMIFNVTLSPASAQPATVLFATAATVGGNSATVVSDFTVTSGTLSFAAGESTKAITVRITGDAAVEANETFLVNLTNPNTAVLGVATATGTILDNDAQISIGNVTISEGDSGTSNMVFPVTLSRVINKSVTANFATANGVGANGALAGSDYIAASGSISFAPGEISKSITVQIVGETSSETDENFSVTLSNLVGALGSVLTGIGTINNNDGIPSFSIDDITVLEGNSGTSSAVFTVTLQPASGQTATVIFATADGSALANVDYVPTNGVLSFAPGQTSQQVTVPILGDTNVESREAFSISLSNATSATILKATGIGTIDDNEQTNLIMTGAGAGGGPHVIAKQSVTLADQFSYFAYHPAFGGGVRVATADVNGDGTADMITAPGAGGGPHVRVLDGRTGNVITEFFAFETNFSGGVFVAAGDTNQDGRAEVIVSTDGPGSNGRIRIFNGVTGQLLNSINAPANYNGGMRVAAGDINGDGRSDVIVSGTKGATPRVTAFDAGSGTILADFFAYNPGFLGGVFVAAGDVTGDGRADIITGADSGGGPHVKIFDGVTRQEIRGFFAYHPNFIGGVRVAVTDFNGDGLVDIITGAGTGGGPHVKIFRGDNLQEIAGFFAYHPNFSGGVYVAGSYRGPGSPLRSPGNGTNDNALPLLDEEIQPLVNQAVANWMAQSPAAAARLQGLHVGVADLPAGYLGMAYADAVYVDINADGHGWFVDATPDQDEEFDNLNGVLQAHENGPAAHGIDLLSVIQHELGHILGLEDLSLDEHDHDLMAEALSIGTRRGAGDAVDAIFSGDLW